MIRTIALAVAAFAAALALGPSASAEDANGDKFWLFVGTYTGPKSKGIYRCTFDATNGSLSKPELAAESTSPSFLAIHPTYRFLYSVNEVAKVGDKKGGGVSAFRLDPKTGELKYLNQQSSVGEGPCHLTVDRVGKNVLVANYGGGSVAALPIDADGSLKEASAFVQHRGPGADPTRKVTPHGHSINVDAANHFAVAADLGLDRLLVYKLDAGKGTLTPNDPPYVSTAAGAGPRHFAFHPNGKMAFVINETDLTMTSFAYDAAKGVLKPLATVSTLPKGEKKGRGQSTAEVVVHPSGKFVYGSNRGHNTIVAFAVNENTGELTLVGHQGEGIKTPRNFNVDPTGRWLLVGNQDGHSVSVFRIDARTGKLEPTGTTVEIGSPVCLRFVSQPG